MLAGVTTQRLGASRALAPHAGAALRTWRICPRKPHITCHLLSSSGCKAKDLYPLMVSRCPTPTCMQMWIMSCMSWARGAGAWGCARDPTRVRHVRRLMVQPALGLLRVLVRDLPRRVLVPVVRLDCGRVRDPAKEARASESLVSRRHRAHLQPSAEPQTSRLAHCPRAESFRHTTLVCLSATGSAHGCAGVRARPASQRMGCPSAPQHARRRSELSLHLWGQRMQGHGFCAGWRSNEHPGGCPRAASYACISTLLTW